MRWLCVIAIGCGSAVDPVATTPAPALVLGPPPMMVVQNNITFVTEAPPAPTPAPPATSTRFAHSVPAACTCYESMPPERADLPSTTVASCDHYLADAERSTRCSVGAPGPARRVIESLDLARRNWRRAAATSEGRESLVESCDLAERQFREAMRESCGG